MQDSIREGNYRFVKHARDFEKLEIKYPICTLIPDEETSHKHGFYINTRKYEAYKSGYLLYNKFFKEGALHIENDGQYDFFTIYDTVEELLSNCEDYKYFDGEKLNSQTLEISSNVFIANRNTIYCNHIEWASSIPFKVHKGDVICEIKDYKIEHNISINALKDCIIYPIHQCNYELGKRWYEVFETWEELLDQHPDDVFAKIVFMVQNDSKVKKGDLLFHTICMDDEIKRYAEQDGYVRFFFTPYIENEEKDPYNVYFTYNNDYCSYIEDEYPTSFFYKLKGMVKGEYMTIVTSIECDDAHRLSKLNDYGEIRTDEFSEEPYIFMNDSFYHAMRYKGIWADIATRYPSLISLTYTLTPFVFDSVDEIRMSLEYREGKAFAKFICNKRRGVKAGNKISFMFSDKQRIDYTFVGKPIKEPDEYLKIKEYLQARNSIRGYKPTDVFSTTLEIYAEDLNLFLNDKVAKVKVEYEDLSVSEIINYNKKESVIIQQLQHDYVRNFIRCLSEIGEPRSRKIVELGIIPEKNTEAETCSVYLMYDTANSCYKIGISNDPNYREQTLQSEKPSIVKIISKEYPHRKIAQAIEKSLHEAFSKKRVRGEWFNLSDEDARMIISTLS